MNNMEKKAFEIPLYKERKKGEKTFHETEKNQCPALTLFLWLLAFFNLR